MMVSLRSGSEDEDGVADTKVSKYMSDKDSVRKMFIGLDGIIHLLQITR